MSDDTTVQLQALLDRLPDGDAADRRALMERAYERLRRLAGSILRESFPGLQGQHELDSVVSDTWMRLHQALASARPPTVVDFFRLAAHKIRQVLLDLAQRQRRRRQRQPPAEGAGSEPCEPADSTHDPARLALWTEFHQRVEKLDEQQRAVFELHHYMGLTQAEVARMLGLEPKKVSRLWIAATDKLAEGLPALDDS
jgi:RNA polymerase sigma factor (sigma-70 family)